MSSRVDLAYNILSYKFRYEKRENESPCRPTI